MTRTRIISGSAFRAKDKGGGWCFPVLPFLCLVRLPTRLSPVPCTFPRDPIAAPGQAPETSPGPVKSGQARVKANRQAAGGTRTGETGTLPAQRESEPVKSLLYRPCNPIFQSECEPTKEWVETGGNDSHSSRLHVNQHADESSPRLTRPPVQTRTDEKTSIWVVQSDQHILGGLSG